MEKLVFALTAFSLLAGSRPSIAPPVQGQARQVRQMPREAEGVPQRQGPLHEV